MRGERQRSEDAAPRSIGRHAARENAAARLPPALREHHRWFSELDLQTDEAAFGDSAQSPSLRHAIDQRAELRVALRARLAQKWQFLVEEGRHSLLEWLRRPLVPEVRTQVESVRPLLERWLHSRPDEASRFAAFFHFANGDLRVPVPPEYAAPPTPAWWSAEPDSSDFLLFAEIALTVLWQGLAPPPERESWRGLARAAVAAQPVFLAVYRPPQALPRALDADPSTFDPERRVGEKEARELHALHASAELPALELLHVQNALAISGRERTAWTLRPARNRPRRSSESSCGS